MLHYAKQHPVVYEYLPKCKREILKMPREYISTVLYSIIGEPFSKWVEKRIDDRNEKIAEDKDLCTELDPEVYAALMNSSSISSK